jgi:hypothetical protein
LKIIKIILVIYNSICNIDNIIYKKGENYERRLCKTRII